MGTLVLSRYPGQSIHIGDEIIVKVISINGEQIKISIFAPNEIKIHRKEIYEKIKRENIVTREVEKGLSRKSYE